jgi:YD repeat-containing protein
VKKHLFLLAALVMGLLLCVPPSTLARQGGTTRYVYDEAGRLHVVISPTGEAVVYDYDAAGNITAVRRVAADALALFAFSPHEGSFGDVVTFTGTGFGAGVNGVSFNGTAARVVEFTNSTVVAEVPVGATTGLVTIDTPRGSLTTDTPFTVRGVRVTPKTARALFGESVQFTADVISGADEGVLWSVNGIDGGNATLGTITASGLYTAPSRGGSVTVRATSVAAPDLFDEAVVTVHDPNDIQELRATVSVQRGPLPGTQAPASAVAVQYGFNNGATAASSAQVSVQHGHESGVNTARGTGVAVQYGFSNESPATTPAPVSVSYGSADGQLSANTSVSATTGPNVGALSPLRVARGASVTLTITGANLAGATSVRFINDVTGVVEPNMTVSNISVSPDGKTLTLTLNVANIAVSNYTAVVCTASACSLTTNVGANAVEVF